MYQQPGQVIYGDAPGVPPTWDPNAGRGAIEYGQTSWHQPPQQRHAESGAPNPAISRASCRSTMMGQQPAAPPAPQAPQSGYGLTDDFTSSYGSVHSSWSAFGATPAPGGAVLWQNMPTGEHVRQWQIFLLGQQISVGTSGPDGQFGPDTAQATRAFQVKHNLTPLGWVDAATAGTAASLGYGKIPTNSTPSVAAGEPWRDRTPAPMRPATKAAVGLGAVGLGLVAWGLLR